MKFSLPSFAKVNLGLKILRKRDDGFRDLVTIFQTVSLHDTITFEEHGDLVFACVDPSIPQDDNLATYCSLLTKQDSYLDPAKLTASEAEARVRAFLDYPRTKITLGDTDTIITMAHTSNFATSKLSIKFKDDNYLVIDELIAPSGKKMTAQAYLRGHEI